MTLVKFKNPGAMTRFVGPSMFSDFFSDFFNDEVMPRDAFKSMPAVNISETPDQYKVELAAPGMEKSDFHVEVENGVLTISAEKKNEKKDSNDRFTRKEFSYTSFTRSFTMPDHVAADNISAGYNNGVLSLSLPKKEDAKKKPTRQIAIS
ncbi:MAG: Hsp20/alpha crystallin family protein [Bacteroidia bacterium]|nr:Hsp20/alpha crystallin family protein [Bacteroidia bacterium]